MNIHSDNGARGDTDNERDTDEHRRANADELSSPHAGEVNSDDDVSLIALESGDDADANDADDGVIPGAVVAARNVRDDGDAAGPSTIADRR